MALVGEEIRGYAFDVFFALICKRDAFEVVGAKRVGFLLNMARENENLAANIRRKVFTCCRVDLGIYDVFP